MKIIELFKLVEDTLTYTLTSSDTDETYLGDTYTPAAIGRTQAENKSEISRNNIELTLAIDHAVAQRYMNSIIDEIVTLTVFTKQDASYLVTWKGRLSAVRPDGVTVRLVFENLFTSMRRTTLRRKFQINCPHVLYGRGCKLNKDDFDVAGTVTGIAASNLTVSGISAYASEYFKGGMIKAPDGTLRFIMNHANPNGLLLIRPIDSLAIGNAVTLYPGCDRTRLTCQNKFGNLNNNGATPFIPIKNPYSGTSFI